jgi:hypothetical protein
MTDIIRPKMKFNARYMHGKVNMNPACDASEALSQLLGTRRSLETNELHLVHKMGFDVEIVGDVKEYKKDIKRIEGEL